MVRPGSIPLEIGFLKALTIVRLGKNKLSGNNN